MSSTPSNPSLDTLSAEQLRLQVKALLAQVSEQDARLQAQDQSLQGYAARIKHHQAREQQLIQEIALLKRHRYGRRSEGLDGHQVSLLQEQIDEDIAALETEVEKRTANPPAKKERSVPKRQPLPPQLPRTVIHHEPDATHCQCGCQMVRIGEDVSEKLDYTPGTFSVERHIRGKWACQSCETLVQEPVAPHIIDKGIPTTNLLAQVLVAKYADHLPLYRQQQQYARAGVDLSRSTLADWVGCCGLALTPLVDALREALKQQPVLHADETPVAMLAPGQKRTHRAYVWAYAATRYAPIQGVVYDFQPTRSGEAVRTFLKDWKGKLVCDDYSGYKASFHQGITEVGCLAHARRKFHDVQVTTNSPIAEQALQTIGLLYEIEQGGADQKSEERLRVRQAKAKPLLDKFRQWLIGQQEQVPPGTGIAKAIAYSLKRWEALIRYLDDGDLPIDNNWVENQIRPWALGRSNWLFAGSLRSGQRAANIMSLIQSAKINGLDPQAYLGDVLMRLPTATYSELDALLPHNWRGKSSC